MARMINVEFQKGAHVHQIDLDSDLCFKAEVAIDFNEIVDLGLEGFLNIVESRFTDEDGESIIIGDFKTRPLRVTGDGDIVFEVKGQIEDDSDET